MDFVKMNWTEDGEFDDNCKIENLPDRAQEFIEEKAESLEYDALSGACGCDSPIEQILGVQIALELGEESDTWARCGVSYDVLEPQAKTEIDGKEYRVDFIIQVSRLTVAHTRKYFQFAIECDGHDFHEKTKFQAAYDKRRDRDLSVRFDLVLHYTGSEIYNGKAIEDLKARIVAFFVRLQRR